MCKECYVEENRITPLFIVKEYIEYVGTKVKKLNSDERRKISIRKIN
jgi:hypothetical protein